MLLGVWLTMSRDTPAHWGCTVGDLHFAIHPLDTFPGERTGVGAVRLAFTVFDIQALVRCLEESGTAVLYPPRDTGFFWSTAIHDPDGNVIEFTQLCDQWFEHLATRRSQGADVVARWRASKA